MKLFIFVFLWCINFITSSAYVIKQVVGVTGTVNETQFDSDLNTVLLSLTDAGSNFYKLNRQNEIIVEQEFGYKIEIMILNKKDDVYFFGRLPPLTPVSRLQHNQSAVKHLFYSLLPTDPVFFIDRSDNIFFNDKSGIVFLKSNQTTPIAIRSLGYVNFDHCDEDEEGNVYLIRTNLVAVVTNEAKDLQVPFANTSIDNEPITGFAIWRNMSLLVEKPDNELSRLRILFGDLLLSQYNVDYHFFGSTNERFFVVDSSSFVDECHLYFIDPDMKVVKIEENLGKDLLNNNGRYAFDQNGTAYFAYSNEILTLKFDEYTFERTILVTEHDVVGLDVDKNGNLWVLADELYLLKNNDDNLLQVSNSQFETNQYSNVKVKKETDEVFIQAAEGLFICTN